MTAHTPKDTQDLEHATATVLKRISSEPAYGKTLYNILVFCETDRTTSAIEQEIGSFPELKTCPQPPQQFLSWLVTAGGIEEIASEVAERMWRTTTAGKNAVRIERPEAKLNNLLAREPAYRDINLQILRSCLVPKETNEVESMLTGNPALENPKVFASFFVGELEKAGGVEWDGKWRTTPAGRMFV